MSILDKLFNKTETEATIETEVIETPVKKVKEQAPEVVDGDQPLVGK
jgi:hypothetical protein